MSIHTSRRLWKHLCLACGLALTVIIGGSCAVKVQTSPYPKALQAYYRALLSGASETELVNAVAALDEELKKSPADAGILALRASARLEMLRLGLQGKSRTFADDKALAFFRDLRLLQNLIDQGGSQSPWLAARVYTMAGDVVLLRALSLPPTDGQQEVYRNIQQTGLYRLAADFYLHAGNAASQAEDANKENKDQLPAILKEKANARDGYINALNGLAQSEEFLRLTDRERQHLLESNQFLAKSDATFPPADQASPTIKSLYSYAHDLMTTQGRALIILTPDFSERIKLAEMVVKETIAAGLLSEPIQSDKAQPEDDYKRLATYYGGHTLPEVKVEVSGVGVLDNEKISLKLMPDPLYGTAQLGAQVPSLNLVVDTGQPVKVVLAVSDRPGVLPSFLVGPDGVQLNINTKTGVTTGFGCEWEGRVIPEYARTFSGGWQAFDNPGADGQRDWLNRHSLNPTAQIVWVGVKL